MFLGIDKLLDLVEKQKLVEGLSDRELNNPEGAGFDLRLGTISILNDDQGFLSTSKRKTPKITTLQEFNKTKPTFVTIEKGVYYLATSIEKVNMPVSFVGILRPRGTLFRSGVILLTCQINPGYKGELTFGLFNASNCNFKLELGARIVHLLVGEINGTSVPYRGQWQGGRIYAPEEDQV